jgi:hypothetical protein
MKSKFKTIKSCAICKSHARFCDWESGTEYFCNFDKSYNRKKELDRAIEWRIAHVVDMNTICDDFEEGEGIDI